MDETAKLKSYFYTSVGIFQSKDDEAGSFKILCLDADGEKYDYILDKYQFAAWLSAHGKIISDREYFKLLDDFWGSSSDDVKPDEVCTVEWLFRRGLLSIGEDPQKDIAFGACADMVFFLPILDSQLTGIELGEDAAKQCRRNKLQLFTASKKERELIEYLCEPIDESGAGTMLGYYKKTKAACKDNDMLVRELEKTNSALDKLMKKTMVAPVGLLARKAKVM